jgi:hypothetical protein
MLIGQVCETIHLPFEGPGPLNQSTKNEIFDWIEANWEVVGEGLQLCVPAREHPGYLVGLALICIATLSRGD